MTTARDVRGYEFDWFAIDRDEHVALFSTAGSGSAPASALANPEAQDALAEAILRLPALGDATTTPAAKGNIADWLNFARRGLYTYDSDFNGGPFHLIAIPKQPILLAALPPALADMLRRIRFDALCFNAQHTIETSILATL